ncbi:MAG: peptide ABC transporter substrate-binding protein, partial [Blastocatellia bacterium]
ADWKVMRQLQEVALDRYCQKILSEIHDTIGDTATGSHQKYLAILRLLHQRDKEMAEVFDNPRRSTAYYQLAFMKKLGMLTDSEWEKFSQETLAAVEILLGTA